MCLFNTLTKIDFNIQSRFSSVNDFPTLYSQDLHPESFLTDNAPSNCVSSDVTVPCISKMNRCRRVKVWTACQCFPSVQNYQKTALDRGFLCRQVSFAWSDSFLECMVFHSVCFTCNSVIQRSYLSKSSRVRAILKHSCG